jgi:hypothetical protein
MFENPILFYSNFCQHSKSFLQNLKTSPELYNAVVKVNIDVDPKTRKRHHLFYDIPKQIGRPITEVPTLIVENYFLVGNDTNKWLHSLLNSQQEQDQQPEQQQEQQEVPFETEGFNPNEMGSFSDSYADINTEGLTSEKRQSYYFINDNHPNLTIEDEKDFQSNSNNQREQFDNTSQSMQKKSQLPPQLQPRSSRPDETSNSSLFDIKMAERAKLDSKFK